MACHILPCSHLRDIMLQFLSLFFLVDYACVNSKKWSVTTSKYSYLHSPWSKWWKSKEIGSVGAEIKMDCSDEISILDGLLFFIHEQTFEMKCATSFLANKICPLWALRYDEDLDNPFLYAILNRSVDEALQVKLALVVYKATFVYIANHFHFHINRD